MGITSFPNQPLSTDDVAVIAQQERIEQVAGLLVVDLTAEEYGIDMNIGLNVDGGLDHDFYLDLIIATGDTIAVAAYPRPDLPPAEDIGPIDDPLEPITDDAP
jgi:ribosomal protein L1